MKKIILVLNILLFAFCSCSSDNNEDEKGDVINSTLLKRKEVYSTDGKKILTFIYVYDGNKIVSEEVKKNDISMGVDVGYNYKTEYTYTGNLITNIKVMNIFSTPYKLLVNTDYVYDNKENLISSIKTNEFGKIKILYDKKSDKIISCKIYNIAINDNTESLLMESNLFFDINDNLIKSESLDSKIIFASYEYNTSFNSKKNVVGLNKFLFFDFPPNFASNTTGFHLERFNNVIKANQNTNLPAKYEYVLNEEGFPVESTLYYDNYGVFIKDLTTKYFYE
ncbi:hypothetical protein [Flavobacterium sp. N3904]|uniref:hypothetical protein n=1 Tax=Flavobacterium sp. N3904 TaxID=2986835 RepID=UPI00222402F9|nr:hypothetical protein [Flavobacterium sp. N3904]